MKRAFTLIEMLVVIGIIGILAGVLMSTFSGGSDSAKAARCLSNLRNLAAACQSAGVEQSYYPLASSIEVKEMEYENGSPKFHYSERKGWIGWNSRGAYAGGATAHKSSASWKVSMYSDDDVARKAAYTNSVLWKTLNGSSSVFLCPVHANKMKDENPCYSYVMNSYFGWDTTKGSGAFLSGHVGTIAYGKLLRADRRLLLAEIQFVQDSKAKLSLPVYTDSTGELTDSVLQHKGDKNASTPEIIGFNHRSGKRNYCAHVAFADGHVEKLTYPKSGLSTSEAQELTQWLCEATDYTFDGNKYEEVTTKDN